ncbi:hypothetical protein IW249_006415 [Micromonospora vinacea]|uniref:RNase H type-1 domain-containing protein n=1 Tax=Micromonospora vinacea TaxID=709878 RepID=A0ABS0KBL7_9ACTN|nr:hypothetical protein [Micromonospora vinacea]MBG6106001.1 hypothetical protein [Micromonospora vinacea]WTA65714.1 hypothetical protein OHB51_24845 [Micromonospora sp. NBC_00855]
MLAIVCRGPRQRSRPHLNECGDGVIVRGGTAPVSRDDKQPHLLASDAKNLLLNALTVYKREHRTLPARVATHKSSRFNPNEVDGLTAAADGRELHALDLIRPAGDQQHAEGVPVGLATTPTTAGIQAAVFEALGSLSRAHPEWGHYDLVPSVIYAPVARDT